LKSLKTKIIFSVGFGMLIYLVFIIFTDRSELLNSFQSFQWEYVAVILLLSTLNYAIRFLKWEYYLHTLKIIVTKKESGIIFLSGFVMTLTPGKMGEVFKSYLLKQVNGTAISKSAPIVIAERVTDFFALLILSISGALTYHFGIKALLAIFIFLTFGILLLRSRTFSETVLSLLEKVPVIGKYVHKVHNMYESIFQLFKFRVMVWSTCISISSWFCECLGLYFVYRGFHLENSLFSATFIYAFSTIIGAISMLPGGLGTTEGSLTALMVNQSISMPIAVASTFIIRIGTLWYAILVGGILLTMYHKKFQSFENLVLEQENN
jgi:uncharacterized protein (TIRG00374 family)